MAASALVLQKLAQLEQELSTAIREFPDPVARDRVNFARSLLRFVRTQIELDEDQTVPVLDTMANYVRKDTG